MPQLYLKLGPYLSWKSIAWIDRIISTLTSNTVEMSSESLSPRRPTSSVENSPATATRSLDQDAAAVNQAAPTAITADATSVPGVSTEGLHGSDQTPEHTDEDDQQRLVSTLGVPNASDGDAQPHATGSPESENESIAREAQRSEHESDTVAGIASPKRSRYSRFFVDWWAKEIIAATISVLCFLCICIVLAVYDGHPQPSIRWGITLNAVIALLTTIMKATLMTPLMEGIGQLKWIAFMGVKRPLNDLNVYDAASRGGFGPLTLFWNMRKRLWRYVWRYNFISAGEAPGRVNEC